MDKENFRKLYRECKKLHLTKSYTDFSRNYCDRSENYLLGIHEDIPKAVVSNIRDKVLKIIHYVPEDYRIGYSKILSILSIS